MIIIAVISRNDMIIMMGKSNSSEGENKRRWRRKRKREKKEKRCRKETVYLAKTLTK
jgi:hypothetical protein